MAYRAPRFSHLHIVRDLGVSSITLLGGDTAHADFPVANLIDDRAGTKFRYAGSQGSPWIVIDLGADFADYDIDRLIIPADHNITANIRIGDDDNPSLSTFSTKRGTYAAVAGNLIDIEFDNVQFQQYLGMQIQATGTFEYRQLFYSKIITFGKGPNLRDSVDEMRDNFVRLVQPQGISPTVQLGPQQRTIQYTYESPLDGDDLTEMESMIAAVGMIKPFYVDPATFTPFTDEPVIWMKFALMPLSANSILVPKSGTRSKTFILDLIENID